jgi:hypothetical protein
MSVPIHTIVFITPDRQPAKLPRGKKAQKQWRCPGCGRAVGADSLIDFETGWAMGEAGRWWVKGICPHCMQRVQFTKSKSVVIDSPHTPGKEWAPVRKTIIQKRRRP